MRKGSFSMKSCMILLMMVSGAAVITAGCSKEERSGAMDRLHSAGTALTGGAVQADKAHATPTIVAEQQRKERLRQNSKWTAENQALHPIEYCQAQLEEIDKMAAALQVQSHKLAMAKSALERKQTDTEAQIKGFTALLKDAKIAYRRADATNVWPMTLGGFQLSKARAQEKIVDAAQRIQTLGTSTSTIKNNIVLLGKRTDTVAAEQRKLVQIRDRIQTTLGNLQTKQVIDGEKGVSDALNAINDSMASLGADDGANPSIDDIMAPDAATVRVQKFDEIMAK